jgi:hypothetical protein
MAVRSSRLIVFAIALIVMVGVVVYESGAILSAVGRVHH